VIPAADAQQNTIMSKGLANPITSDEVGQCGEGRD